MANPSISIPDELVEEIDRRRESTTSRSEWIRGAIGVRIKLEDDGEWADIDPNLRGGDEQNVTADD